jgi:hypothetical protein
LSIHTARPTDILYAVNFVLSLVNTVDSLTLIKVSFLSLITVVVVAGVSISFSSLSLTIEVVLSVLFLSLVDMMIICVRSVVSYI